jgi:PIN domain nuclease of toxin-antitoxin system
MPGSVLDSFALIAYFRDEAGADKVEALPEKVLQNISLTYFLGWRITFRRE